MRLRSVSGAALSQTTIVRVQRSSAVSAAHGAAACRQNCRTFVDSCADGIAFHGAELVLAGDLKDLGNADPGCLDNAGVTVDEGKVEFL